MTLKKHYACFQKTKNMFVKKIFTLVQTLLQITVNKEIKTHSNIILANSEHSFLKHITYSDKKAKVVLSFSSTALFCKHLIRCILCTFEQTQLTPWCEADAVKQVKPCLDSTALRLEQAESLHSVRHRLFGRL